MRTLIRKKKTPRDRIAEIGQSVSAHTVEAGHKVREELDELVPKAAAAASQALHSAARTPSKARKLVLLLTAAGGAAAIWTLWWKRSRIDWDSQLEEVAPSDPGSVGDHVEGFAGPNS